MVRVFGSDSFYVYVCLMLTLFNPSSTGGTKDFKLPPIDLSDKTRCSLKSSNIGQANAARDKLYDLRQCSFAGEKAVGFDLSGVIMSKTDVSKANFREAYFSKAYLHGKFVDELGLLFVRRRACFFPGLV
jgi:hypothetical protein